MERRDNKGRFIKGSTADDKPIEERIKTMYSLQDSWRKRPDYIGDIKDKNPYIYNTWRGLMYTDKGKKQGISEEWKSFRNFYNDVSSTYEKGKVFRRLDTSKHYCKENFIWVTHEEEKLLKSNLVTLEYEGLKLSLKEWADKTNNTLSAIKNRYYKRDTHEYTTKEIIYGRVRKRGSKKVKDISETLEPRAKASKMISSYKCRDRRLGVSICDIDIDWMIENIISKPCVYCGDTYRIGCDRIDNTKGHTKDNVLPCCYECNTVRNNNFTVDEMKILGKTIQEIKSKRNN